MLCQRCKKHTATVHLTEIVKSEKREKHLCEKCAAEEGVTMKQHVPLNELLTSFLVSQAGAQEWSELSCPECGMSFVEFRSRGLLGCPHDYDAFGDALANVIQRAQDNHTQHTGKSPGQLMEIDPVEQKRLQLQRELREAVDKEDYEQAALLRDRLAELEGSP